VSRHLKIAALLLALPLVLLVLWWTTSSPTPDDSAAADGDAETVRSAASFIAGHVVDATGEPIEGAMIEGAMIEASGNLRVESGADGSFRFSGLQPGAYRIDARAEGFVAGGPPGMRRVEVVLSADGAASSVRDLRLVLRRAAAVSGRIVASGRPVAGAKIGVYYLSAQGLNGELDSYVVDAAATSDERGKFELIQLTPGRLKLLVEAPDYALAESPTILLEPGESFGPLVVDLAPSATIAGAVVDAAGEPVEAELVLRASAVGSADMPNSRRVRAGRDGRYVFRNIPAGSYVLTTSATGFRSTSVGDIIAVVGKTSERNIVMKAASGIFGRVVGPGGAGVDEAFVLLRPPRGRAKRLRTDRDGYFHWEDAAALAAREYTAIAVSPHYASAPAQSVRPGKAATFELGRGGSVSGRVVGPGGRPVQAFSIGVGAFEVDGPRPYGARSIGIEQVNDSAGRFRIASLRPGKYWLRVQSPRFAPATSTRVVILPGAEFSGLVIRVGQAGRVVGTVINSETGKPVAKAAVTLFDPTSPFSANQTRTDASGRFELDGVPPGRRSLRVTKKGFLSTVAAGLQVAPGQVATRNISIRPQKPGERMQFQGIGAMLSKRDDGIRVERVFEGHPASQFGLESRDFILAVDGESVENLPLAHVIEKIRGRRGVPVELEIERPSQGRMTLEIVRGQVIVKR
jgi:protocatechuate 3,4-dioxygenase beta subunit